MRETFTEIFKYIKRYTGRHWRLLLGLLVAVTVSVAGMAIVFADDVIMQFTVTDATGANADTKYQWEVTDGTADIAVTITNLSTPVDVNNITWQSNNTDVLIIDKKPDGSGNGTITFRGAGTATVSCTYDDGSNIKTETKEFKVTLKKGDITSAFDVLAIDDVRYLTTNCSQSISNVTWTSSNEKVIQIVPNNSGMLNAWSGGVKAVGAGTATVTARTPDGQAVEFQFLVKAKFGKKDTVVVKPADYADVYETAKAVAGDPQYLTWFTDDTENIHISVDQIGRVQGFKAGMARVYMYTAYNDYQTIAPDIAGDKTALAAAYGDYVDVKVEFGINAGDKTMAVGDTATLSCNVEDRFANSISWNSSDNNVVTIDQDGTLHARSAGTATITAQIRGTQLYPNEAGVLHTASIQVKVIDSFALNETVHILNKGDTFVLKAIPTDTSKSTKITWSSSDSRVAAIDSVDETNYSAVVKGIGNGVVTITATQTTADGVIKKAECKVTVQEPVYSVEIQPSNVEITKGESYQLTLIFNNNANVYPDNLNVTWVSSDMSIATVQKSTQVNGIVTGVGGGDAVISAITEDGTHVASSKIHVRVPVTGVSLSETSVEASMSLEKYQLSYTIAPEGEGVNRAVTWSSSNESVVKVDQNGLVQFISPGKATVICQTIDTGTNGTNLIATCDFVITQPVTSVKLDYNDITLKVGDTFRLTANVQPADATNKELWWSTSNNSVVTIDETGNITAVGSGNATVICQSADSGVFDVCNVAVYQPVTGVKLNKNEITVRKGTVFWLNATITPDNAWNKTVTWSSSDPEVATVDETGMVTTLLPGECSIIATSNDTGVVDKCTLVVTEPVTGIELNISEATVYTGEKVVIIPNITPIDADNKRVTYVSSDPAVATVDENGIVTGVSGGSAIIIVTTEERGLVASCKITVYEFVNNIQIEEKPSQINRGVTKRLKAVVTPKTATNTGVTWSSSNPSVISIDGHGNMTANGYGTVTITATAADGSGVYDSFVITSVRPVESISVNPSSVTIMEGNSASVNATVNPSNATYSDIDWSSSNTDVATVDYSGEITGVKAGVCYVYATSTDGNKITARVKVTVKPAVPATAVVLNSDKLVLLPGQSRSLKARLRPTKSTDGVEWIAGDTSVATVSSNGTIYARGQGETQIYCVADSGVESSCTVIVLALNSSKITIEQYDDYQLDVFGATEKIKWYTSNRRIATVDANGKVIGRGVGKTTITAKVNGKILYCTVYVTRLKRY